MSTTQENQVAGVINRLVLLGGSAGDLKRQIERAVADYTALGAATKLAAFPTAPLTSTGGLGTADASPNAANPVDTRVSPGNQLDRAISGSDMTALVAYLTALAAGIGGAAVSTNAAATTILARTA